MSAFADKISAIDSTGGKTPHWVALADFNSDGKLDVGVADCGDANGMNGGVKVLFNNGGGVFAAPVASRAPAIEASDSRRRLASAHASRRRRSRAGRRSTPRPSTRTPHPEPTAWSAGQQVALALRIRRKMSPRMGVLVLNSDFAARGGPQKSDHPLS